MSHTTSQERHKTNPARCHIELAPPTFIFMTDQQSEHAARALAAVLLPMICEWQRPARQTREEDSPDHRHCRSLSRSAGSYPIAPPR